MDNSIKYKFRNPLFQDLILLFIRSFALSLCFQEPHLGVLFDVRNSQSSYLLQTKDGGHSHSWSSQPGRGGAQDDDQQSVILASHWHKKKHNTRTSLVNTLIIHLWLANTLNTRLLLVNTLNTRLSWVNTFYTCPSFVNTLNTCLSLADTLNTRL